MVPYLTVRKDAVEKWRSKLGTQKLKVGIAWAGNPDFGGDRDRSILLKNIFPVTRIDGIEYFSLQKDLRDGDDQLLNANPRIVRVDKEINDFQDTAAIMMSQNPKKEGAVMAVTDWRLIRLAIGGFGLSLQSQRHR